MCISFFYRHLDIWNFKLTVKQINALIYAIYAFIERSLGIKII